LSQRPSLVATMGCRHTYLSGGALADPVDMGVLVFTDKSVAENFAAADAYVKAGLVKEWQVRQWTVVAGSKI